MNKQELFKHFFEITLKNLLSGEKVLKEALGKLASQASSEELKRALTHHQKETQQQEQRLEEILNSLGIEHNKNRIEEAEGVINKGKEALKSLASFSLKKGNPLIEKMTEELSETLDYLKGTELLDNVIASGNQLVEQAEVIGYTTAINLAEALELKDVVSLLQKSLEEEKKAFELMSKIAKDSSLTSAMANK